MEEKFKENEKAMKVSFTEPQRLQCETLRSKKERIAFWQNWKKWSRAWASFREGNLSLMPERMQKELSDRLKKSSSWEDSLKDVKKQHKKWRAKAVREMKSSMTKEKKKTYDELSKAEKARHFLNYLKDTHGITSRKQKREDEKNKKTKNKVKCRDDCDLYTQRIRTLPDAIREFDGDPPQQDGCVRYTKRIRFYPTESQKEILRKCMGCYRYTHNEMVALMQDGDRCQEIEAFQGLRKPRFEKTLFLIFFLLQFSPFSSFVLRRFFFFFFLSFLLWSKSLSLLLHFLFFFRIHHFD